MPASKLAPLSTGVAPLKGVGPLALSVQARGDRGATVVVDDDLVEVQAGALSSLVMVQLALSPFARVI